MPTTVNLATTDAPLMTALGGFLVSVLPHCDVRRSRQNGEVMPKGDSIYMTTIGIEYLSTNRVSFDPANNQQIITKSLRWRVQIDFYGAGAADNAANIVTLAMTSYACRAFRSQGLEMQPLYTEGPRCLTFINGENDYEPRWSLDYHLQFNPSVSVPMDFADQLQIGLVEVDTKYPPEK